MPPRLELSAGVGCQRRRQASGQRSRLAVNGDSQDNRVDPRLAGPKKDPESLIVEGVEVVQGEIAGTRRRRRRRLVHPAASFLKAFCWAARSDCTIMLTNSSNATFGCQPSTRLALEASPVSRSTSAGRRNRESSLTTWSR